MGLVDSVLERKNTIEKRVISLDTIPVRKELPDVDELGLKVVMNTDYVVARILMLNPGLAKTTAGLYNNMAYVQMCQSSLYHLAKIGVPIPLYLQQIIWDKVMSLVPIISKKQIIVMDGVAWDAEKGELVFNGNARR